MDEPVKVVVSRDLFNEILGILGRCPWSDVHGVMTRVLDELGPPEDSAEMLPPQIEKESES